MFVKVTECWECYECSSLLYTPAPVVYAYYSSIVLSGSNNSLPLRVAVAEHAVICVKSFISPALYSGSCTASGDFQGVENICWNGIVLPLCQGVLEFSHDVGSLNIARGCSFDIA